MTWRRARILTTASLLLVVWAWMTYKRTKPIALNLSSSTENLIASHYLRNYDRHAKQERKSNPNSKFITLRDLYTPGHRVSHPEICHSYGQGLKLMVLVMSSVNNYQARLGIRFTWGQIAKQYKVQLAFILGAVSPSLEKAVKSEDEIYKDIVIGNFVDSYQNLSVKTISALEWIVSYCPKVNKVLKTDDDMFINIPRLMSFVEERSNHNNSIWGRVCNSFPPKRSARSTHYLSYRLFPEKALPDFTSGPAYLLSGDIIPALYLQAFSKSQPYISCEDVFITGFLASQLNIKRAHSAGFYNEYDPVAYNSCYVKSGISMHSVRFHEQFALWKLLLDTKVKCPDNSVNTV